MNFRTWLRAEWDRVLAVSLIVLGAVLLLVGYLGVRRTPFTVEAISYIASGGLPGLFCLGLGVGLLLTAGLHDEWRKLDRIERVLRHEDVNLEDPPSGRDGVSGSSQPVDEPILVLGSDWQGSGVARAVKVSSAALLPAIGLLVVGAGATRRARFVDSAVDGTALAISGLILAFAVTAAAVVWLRTRVVRRTDLVLSSAVNLATVDSE